MFNATIILYFKFSETYKNNFVFHSIMFINFITSVIENLIFRRNEHKLKLKLKLKLKQFIIIDRKNYIIIFHTLLLYILVS